MKVCLGKKDPVTGEFWVLFAHVCKKCKERTECKEIAKQ